MEQPYMLSIYDSNTMPADALATLGATASASMSFTTQGRNIPYSA